MKILFLHSGDRSPSSRFRVLPYRAAVLQLAGHRCTLAGSRPQKYEHFPWLGFRPSQRLKRLVRYWHLARAHRGSLRRRRRRGAQTVRRRIDRHGRPFLASGGVSFVVEIDDAIFLRIPRRPRQALAGWQTISSSETSGLAEYARQHHDRITIIPTCIELDSYTREGAGEASPQHASCRGLDRDRPRTSRTWPSWPPHSADFRSDTTSNSASSRTTLGRCSRWIWGASTFDSSPGRGAAKWTRCGASTSG